MLTRTRHRARLSRFLHCQPLEPRVLLTTYYVSPTGNDAAAGTSPAAPWKTIAKANTLNLDPGDQLLFQGGSTFNLPTGQSSQTLTFDSTDSGTSANAVTIGEYGSGRATINCGDSNGLVATDVAGFVVQDLTLTGTWNGLAHTGTNNGEGILFFNDLSNNTKLNYIRVNDVDVSGFKLGGISVVNNGGKSGYTDLRITNSATHDNGDYGIDIEGSFNAASTQYSNSNVYVGYCLAYNNGGIPNKNNHSGDGIIVGDTDGATVERNTAYNNGQNNNYPNGGPVGIWTWDSNNITIQYNESYANKTGSGSLDGGGFDLDGGVTNSTLQYNYSHDNYGAGILLYQFAGARPYGNNTVRYNISQNDARTGHYAGIYLGGGAGMTNNQIYNNDIYLTPGNDTSIAAVKITGAGLNNNFRNNVFYTTASVALLNCDASSSSTNNVLFQGNDWFNTTSSRLFFYGNQTYTSLTSWRSITGQEKNGATNTGSTSDPNFVTAGGGTTFNDATQLQTLVPYELNSTSQIINAGVDLTSFGISPGSHDFFGGSIPSGTFDIGAFESNPATSGTASADSFTLRLGPTGNIELFINTPTTSAPTLAWSPKVYTTYAITGAGGTDTFTLDLSNGSPLPTSGASFTASGSTSHLIVTGSPNADALNFVVSSLFVNGGSAAFTYSGIADVSVNTGQGDDTLRFIATGPLASPAINLGTGNDSLTINSGSYAFNADASTISPNLSVTVAASATATFNTTQHLAALDIFGSAAIAAGANKVLVTKSLTLEPNAQLNINDNAIIVDYTGANSPIGTWTNNAYTGLTGAIATGRNNGFWNGQGIVSYFAMANGFRYTVGIAESKDAFNLPANGTTLFAGQLVDATAVLIRYTEAGDTDLNQRITGDDYFRTDNAFPLQTRAFAAGDFDYNGHIDADDYWFLDANYSHPLA